jgi:hypothetical protein
VAVTWDTCHKIYVIKNADALSDMVASGYGKEEGSLVLAVDSDPSTLFDTVEDWYEESCELKMIDLISVVDGETVFETLVGQFEEDEEEEE